MADFFRQRWVLFVVLVVFTVCKLPHLHYAYYWDESWPYAIAIKAMYNHGISLMPGSVDPELTRGHPLFFHAAAATWMHIFGASHESMHSFALLISLLFLVAVYEAGLRIFNRRAAIIAIVLVATQMIFFVQSAFVLFDMLVAFLSFLSIYLYTREKYILTALSLSILFYTKESGMIAGFVIGIHALIAFFDKTAALREKLARLACVAVPCVLTGIFFILQKHINGWYIFPLYNNLIEHSWTNFWYCFRINCLLTTFVADMRYHDFYILLALSVVAAIKLRDYRYLALFLPAICIYYFVDDMRTGRIMPGIPFFIVFVLSILLSLGALLKLRIAEKTEQQQFIILISAFIFCFWVFSAMNFFTPRYLLAVIVPLLLFAAVVIDFLIRRTYNWLFYAVLPLILCASAYTFATDAQYGDCDMGAFDALDVQQHVVDYLEQNNAYDKNIGCSFLEHEHLTEAACGFLRGNRVFTKVRWEMDSNSDYCIFDNIETDARYQSIPKVPGVVLKYRYQKGKVWTEIYGRK